MRLTSKYNRRAALCSPLVLDTGLGWLGWAGLGWAGARLTSDSDPTDFITAPNYATTAVLPRTLQLHCSVCCSR